MPFNMGPGEILLIFLLVVILFGAKRLPELAKSMGKSIKEFKHATQGLRDELDMDKIDESPRKSQNQSTSQSTSAPSAETTEKKD